MNIPKVGYGTYRLKGEVVYNSVRCALNSGYRHIDTAVLYKNHVEIGRAIHDTNVERSDLFITTKIRKQDMIDGKIISSFEQSLTDLKMEYVDLLLLHNPIDDVDKLKKCWETLIDLYFSGNVRYIGVSNFEIKHLMMLKQCRVQPMVNQIELSPFFTRNQLTKYCKDNNITIVAHTSLTKGVTLNDQTIIDIAAKYKTTVASIMLSWALQKDYIILPCSSNEQHIKENLISKIAIDPVDIEKLDNLNINKSFLKCFTK